MIIDPYTFPTMSLMISDGKEHAKTTVEQPDLLGLSEKTHKMHFLQNSQRERAIVKNLHSHICINVISSSGRLALPPLFGELEQRGEGGRGGKPKADHC